MTASQRRPVLGGMGPFLFGATAMFAVDVLDAGDPARARAEFGVTPVAGRPELSVVIGALAVGAWFWGPLSDRIGRRASLVLARARSSSRRSWSRSRRASGPARVRALQGLCMPGLLTVGVPYVTEAYTARIGDARDGLLRTALVAGGLIGRVAVALMTAALGWRVALAALALLLLASTIVMRRGAAARSRRRRRAGRRSTRRLATLAATRR